MTSTGETLKNLAIRTVAFVVLTAASTTVLALPYISCAGRRFGLASGSDHALHRTDQPIDVLRP